VLSALTGTRSRVHILGPLHGVNFLILLVTAGTAALDGLWGWWFPALILVTDSPIGTFIGERVIIRREATLISVREDAATRGMPRASGADGRADG